MALERFPALAALHRDLSRLDASERVRDRLDEVRASRRRTTMSLPWAGDYPMSQEQAEVCRQLIAAYLDGRPEVEERTLLRRAKSQAESLEALFRDHPALGEWIVRGRSGKWRIVSPE